MTIINGAALGSGSTNWNHTFIGRSVQLPAGANITSIGAYLTIAAPVVLKISLENSAASQSVQLSESLAHPGGGWADVTLPTPYIVPQSGIYRLAGYFNGLTDQSVSAARASKPGNVTGSGSFDLAASAPMPVMRATTDGTAPEPDPDPDPDPIPDPSGGKHFLYLFMGQSNMTALPIQPFLDRMAQLVPGVTHEVVKSTTNSSFIMPDGSSAHWQPGGGLVEAAKAAIDGALAANPDATLAGIHWYQGEAQTRAGREESIVRYPEMLRNVFDHINRPNVPKFVVELHEQPDATYPRWPNMQYMQRQMADQTDPFAYVDNTILVSAADQNATIDDGLHLTQGALTVVSERLADAQAKVIWPR